MVEEVDEPPRKQLSPTITKPTDTQRDTPDIPEEPKLESIASELSSDEVKQIYKSSMKYMRHVT